MPPEGTTVTFRRPAAGVRPRALARFARRLQSEVAGGRAFDCLITGDVELRRLNREFRGKDYATDVLSFRANRSLTVAAQKRDATEPRPSGSGMYLGDIAISIQRARAQGRKFGHGTEHEIRILMLHGLLHLLGMDHESDRGEMARAELRWRTKLGLRNGLIERVSA